MDMLPTQLGLRSLPLPDSGSLDWPVRELRLSSPEINSKNGSFLHADRPSIETSESMSGINYHSQHRLLAACFNSLS